MPAEIDFGKSFLINILNEFVNKSYPFIKIGVLNGIFILGRAVVIGVRSEAIGKEASVLAVNYKVYLHTLGEHLPAGTGNLELVFGS